MTLPMQGAMAMANSIVNFAGQAVVRPDKLKDDSKNVNGQINVSCLSVFHKLIFMVNQCPKN